MELLKGKTVLVTGGARGIGRSIVKTCAAQGANVAFSDLNEDDNFRSLVAEISATGVKCIGYVSDASKYDSANELIDKVVADFQTIDVMVNNAGITRDALLMRMTEEQWDLVINVNLKSVFNMTKAVQKVMLKQRSGSIVNITSVVGVGGNAGQANYSASKAGMIGFTKSVAKELGSRNVRCNAIAPGFIETEMTASLPEEVKNGWYEKIPLKRGGKPEDVANAVVFLGSDLSSYISGQVILVCGGMQM
jgi:3-oxoacyl-[acyl-carrier protein] reductase